MVEDQSPRSSTVGLSDDELLAVGAELERRLSEIADGVDVAKRAIADEQRAIRKATIKLGLNTIIAIGGIVAAPITLGLSLAFTAGGLVMLLWDGVDHAKDRARLRAVRIHARQLRVGAETIEQDLTAVVTELEARTRR